MRDAKTASNWNCRCAWLGPGELWDAWHAQNDGKFCGTEYVPDDFSRGWRRQREQCCGVRTWGTYIAPGLSILTGLKIS